MQVSALRRVGTRAAALVGALLALSLFVAASAGATTFTWYSVLSGQDIIASHLPANGSASGSATFNVNTSTNQLCGTIGWSGVASPVVFGHIHEGQYGVPENPAYTINLFGPNFNGAPNPVSFCAIVPGPVVAQMFHYPEFFNVVVHNKQFPGGAIRGQLGGGTLKCQLGLCPGP
jgi:hypothetical protein